MLLESSCAVSCGLIVYHHVVYPLTMRTIAPRTPDPAAGRPFAHDLSLTIVVPAYNEAGTIGAKIRNSALCQYPAGKLRIIIACDGCDDETAARAHEAIAQIGTASSRFEVIDFPRNRGKVAVINEVIANIEADLVALSDASAHLEPNALLLAASHFADARVGFVTGTYDSQSSDSAIRSYWSYQNAIKRAEGALGSPIGAHGAFYVIRRSEWAPLEVDTINDDVVLPMRIVQRGFNGIYDERIAIVEAEQDSLSVDIRRRRRLAAGALQQTLRLAGIANPSRPGLAFSFLSGKALRSIMPFLMLIALATNAALAMTSPAWALLLACQLAFYGGGIAGMISERVRNNSLVAALSYLVSGHVNGLVGCVNYLTGKYDKPWTRERLAKTNENFVPTLVKIGKRTLDVVVATGAFVLFALLFTPIALAIRLESKGPVFYRQLRVGLRTSSQSRLFYLTKFRTMRVDAEALSGAVWASKNDPRITRVGQFLRKTRLDELPQCMDVLRGDMSIVGPRPERPQFFNNLEMSIPFYAERTYGLKPGITGLAQVCLPYDSSIDDVRAKVLYDHAYAMQLTAPGKWLLADLGIIMRTFTVMVLGKGQ